MSNQPHHGMKEKHFISAMCSLESYSKERIGGFGRLFRSEHNVHPLIVNPNTLVEIGKKGGPMDGGTTFEFTTSVPLGMVFLGQFIDHDITLDTSSKFDRINNPLEIENFRTPNLDLDCVFGEGPDDEPFLYEAGTLKLLKGDTNHNFNQGPQLEKNDLARNGDGKAIIGDPRNDENRIISQLQLAFIKFYNKVYEMVSAANPSFSSQQIYEEARQTVTWHYQWMIVHEFLPTMIGTNLTNRILRDGRKWYSPCSRAFMPIEFSAAAYRFGHSMVAQKMRLQTGGAQHDIFSPAIGLPFSKISNLNQVVEWRQFFNIDGTHQLAETLNTKLATSLLELPFIPASAPPHEKSLATRNLRRAHSFLLPSGEAVADCLIKSGQLTQGDADRTADFIRDTLNTFGIHLPTGTPLWYYILAEAEELGKDGAPKEGLGPVGGTIVGEVILGLIELDNNSYLGSNRNWVPTLTGNGNFTMKDLIAIAES